MSQKHLWTVDGLEGAIARVEVDGGEARTMPRWLLPSDARDGDVLRVTHDRFGQRSVLTIEVDVEATGNARDASRAQLKSAPKGTKGDITL